MCSSVASLLTSQWSLCWLLLSRTGGFLNAISEVLFIGLYLNKIDCALYLNGCVLVLFFLTFELIDACLEDDKQQKRENAFRRWLQITNTPLSHGRAHKSG